MAIRIDWTATHPVDADFDGIHRVDQQHQSMVDKAAELLDLMATGNEDPRLRGGARELLLDAETHWRQEEGLIEQNDPAALAAHKEKHREIREGLMRFLETPNADAALRADFRSLLIDWIFDHILGETSGVVRLEWSPMFCIDNGELDRDHKILLQHANRVIDSADEDYDDSSLRQFVESLREDAGVHFRAEEALMQSTAHPDYDRHKQEHEELAARLDAITDMAQDTKTLAFCLRQLMVDWVFGHILVMDARLKQPPE